MSEGDAKRLSHDWMMTCFKDKILKKYCLNTGDYRYIGSKRMLEIDDFFSDKFNKIRKIVG